jgi:type II secretory pathway pseudopilin PulG
VPLSTASVVVTVDASEPAGLLEVLIALGTVGAVIAAVVTAILGNRAANRRAEQDRAAFAERQREERAQDRRVASARWRLDHLVRLV